MDYKAIGERVRQRRRELHLTQEELAKRAGISASFLGHIERGTRVQSVETLVELCRALALTPNEVLCMEHSTRTAELPEELRAFSQELMQCAIDLMRRHLVQKEEQK